MPGPVSYLLRPLFSVLLLTLLWSIPAAAEFSFVRINGVAPGPTLFITAGIDGDEPGGIHAAATLITRYQIRSGQLWVAPDLNPEAILLRERGEMNLKFAGVDRDDPLFAPVNRLKTIVRNHQFDLLVNLHDGSGFYHPTRLSRERGPYRWGQSVVIDQEALPGVRFGALHDLAAAIIDRTRSAVLVANEHFQIKNMHTATLNPEAPTRKSLSWFALRHDKPALTIEASKTHPVHIRTYYHLVALEALMDTVGIKFTRDFELTPQAVAQVIREDAQMTLAQGRIHLDLNKMHHTLYNFPLPANPQNGISAINPLISLQPEDGGYRIHYGNNRLALLRPRQVKIDSYFEPIPMIIDGKSQLVAPGTILPVASHVQIEPSPRYRFALAGHNGSWEPRATSIEGRQVSIDRDGRLLRLEIYRDEVFNGMILLDFRQDDDGEEDG